MPRKTLNTELDRLSVSDFKTAVKQPVVLILDNLRSQHNIGSAFRTADAFRLERICLCGICATPPSAQMHKSALGAEDTVDWTYYPTTLEAVAEYKAAGYTVVAVEQAQDAAQLDAFVPEPGCKYALVFGNEVFGVEQAVVDAAHSCLEIPQWGTKHSLNVSVSIGVVLWAFISQLPRL